MIRSQTVTLVAVALLVALPVAGQSERRAAEEAAYPVTTAAIPADIPLEIGGIALVDPPGDRESWNGPRVVVVTRRGEVYGVDGFAGPEPSSEVTVALLAEGLHEPLGLLVEPDGSLLSACRSELVRLRDIDGDGRFERQEVVADDWSISGNYHEYNFGPTRSADGSLWITTNKPFGDEPFGAVDWRGYAFRILQGGEVKPMCAGLRSPAGIAAAPWGEVFYTDNQGEWCGASKLSLLAPGSYHGHPHGIASTLDARWTFPKPKALPEGATLAAVAASGAYPAYQRPTVWFPYDKMGRSPAEFVWDTTEGKFGPFEGQVFVADQFEAAVFRVALERVRGHWQGVCFRFRDGLACGATRLEFTPSGALLVGETSRGWGSKGSLDEGLQRIDWSGVVPFEMHTVKLLEDGKGFRIRFTQAVNGASVAAADSYGVSSYTYLATERYGSPEVDTAQHSILAVEPHADGRGVDLAVEGMREGYVFEVHANGVRSGGAERALVHPTAYYTVGRL